MSKVNQKEIRTLTMPIELRAAPDEADARYIVGYALRFNSESDNLGGFVEKIDATALDNANLSDVRALFNHNSSMVLGRSKAGTLKLEVDELGLKYTINPPDTSFARDLMNSMDRGDIDQSSFGFTIDYANDGDTWEYDENRDLYVRTIHRFKDIMDVSVVTFPAYQATESVVAQRGLENHKNDLQRKIKQRQIAIELDLI